MGCGKSSVGRRLSALLSCSYADLDAIIEKAAGRTIPEIFTSEGEAAFRAMELTELERVVTSEAHQAGQRKQSLPSQAMGPSLCGPRGSTAFATQPDGPLVLSLGGGTVMTPECAKLVHEHTVCIYLRTSLDVLVERLKSESDGRPMLSNAGAVGSPIDALRARIAALMAQRSSTYENTAHYTVDTDGKSLDGIAEEILQLIRYNN